MRLTAGIFLAATLFAAFPAATASAAADAVLVTDKLTVTVDDESTASGTLTFLNTTDRPVKLTFVPPSSPAGCAIAPVASELPAGRQQEVQVTLTGCHPEDGDGLKLAIASPGQSWNITAAVSAPGKPDWNRMQWFPISGALAAIVTIIVFIFWNVARPKSKAEGGKPPAAAKRGLGTPLPGLGGKYDFSKSWASNVTIISGAFAAVFGSSEVVKAILGKEDKSVLAVVVVAAAVAVGLVAAGPLIVLATRSGKYPSAGGLLLAAVFTLAGAGGQLGVLVQTGANLELGLVDEVVPFLGGLGTVLLLVYGFRSLNQALSDGLSDPDPDTVEVVTAADAPTPEYLAQVMGIGGDESRVHVFAPSSSVVVTRLHRAHRSSAVL
jgi:hypothetical protein